MAQNSVTHPVSRLNPPAHIVNPQEVDALRNGSELWVGYQGPFRTSKWQYRYCYRHTDAELFSCIAPNVASARKMRDKWIKARAA